MPNKPSHAVRLAKNVKSTVDPTVRGKFNALVNKLEAERKRLAAWHEAVPRARARAEAELRPLSTRLRKCQRELVMLFDGAFTNKQITKKEREKLSDIICGMAMDMLDQDVDAELEAIFKRHVGSDELANDPDYLAFKEAMDQMLEEAQGGAKAPGGGRKSARKKNAQAARQAEEATRLAQSVREIFRKLVSALHPDRETDPAEHMRKTALMQRVNAAYAGNDLLGLLELQFEVDQIDASKLDTLGEARIRQYNKMLSKQVDEVRREIDELEHWLMYEMQVSPRGGRLTPGLMDKALSHEINAFWVRLAEMERDVQVFQDIALLKVFLKTYRIQPSFDYMNDAYF